MYLKNVVLFIKIITHKRKNIHKNLDQRIELLVIDKLQIPSIPSQSPPFVKYPHFPTYARFLEVPSPFNKGGVHTMKLSNSFITSNTVKPTK